jgi:hypothetical protein
MSDADAREMAHPTPWNAASLIVSPSSRSQTVSWSPQSGLWPSARWSASSIAR